MVIPFIYRKPIYCMYNQVSSSTKYRISSINDVGLHQPHVCEISLTRDLEDYSKVPIIKHPHERQISSPSFMIVIIIEIIMNLNITLVMLEFWHNLALKE
jgi:hypothetical protein